MKIYTKTGDAGRHRTVRRRPRRQEPSTRRGIRRRRRAERGARAGAGDRSDAAHRRRRRSRFNATCSRSARCWRRRISRRCGSTSTRRRIDDARIADLEHAIDDGRRRARAAPRVHHSRRHAQGGGAACRAHRVSPRRAARRRARGRHGDPAGRRHLSEPPVRSAVHARARREPARRGGRSAVVDSTREVALRFLSRGDRQRCRDAAGRDRSLGGAGTSLRGDHGCQRRSTVRVDRARRDRPVAHGGDHDSRRRSAQDARGVGATSPTRLLAAELRPRLDDHCARRRRRGRSRGLRRRDVHARRALRAGADDVCSP